MGALQVFNLAKTLVLVPHKNQKCQVKKPKYKKVGAQAAEDEKQIRTSTWWINHPGSVNPHEILQSSLIDTVFYLLVKNNKGRGGGVGVKTEGGLLLKLFSYEKEGLLERGGLVIIGFLPRRCHKKVNSVSTVCNITIQSMVYFTYYLGLHFAMSMCKLTKG